MIHLRSKIIIGIFLVFLTSNSFSEIANVKGKPKGPLKLNQEVADVVEYYFSGGTKGYYGEKQKVGWKPGLMVISEDGTAYGIIRHPLNVQNVDKKNYIAMAKRQCTKNFGKKCYLFANGYKIVWDNGTDKKKRKLKKKQIMNGETIPILISLGFFDPQGISKTNNSDNSDSNNSQSNTAKNNSDEDIVKKLKELKKLYDDGILSKEEFEKAKGKLLN